jgi:hypothetical protein
MYNTIPANVKVNCPQLKQKTHTCTPDLRGLRLWAAGYRAIQFGFSSYIYLARTLSARFHGLPAQVKNDADLAEKLRHKGNL